MRIQKIALFLFPIVLILFYWKNTLLNVSANLYSWFDGSFVIWLFQNNLRHFNSLDFAHMFETNAMYPFPLSLSFTEHMFFPSFIVWMLSFITKSPIAQFNILAVVNHIVLYLSFYLLSGRFTKSHSTKVLTSFFVAFSPYYANQIGHIQMVFFWPFLLSIYYILEPKRKYTHVLIAGLLLGLQFLSAVYLALLGFGIIALYYVLNAPKEDFRRAIKEIALFLASFSFVSLPSIVGYLLMQRMYKPVYEQSQYVTYAAHLSDYFLNFSNSSILNIYFFIPLIGKYNKHFFGEMATFVGLVPLALIGFWVIKNIRSNKKYLSEHKTIMIWLALLVVVGIVFSLGPRMNWNGKYLVTPLPYWFIIKFVPVIGVMRAVARYYFLVIFAVSIALIFAIDFIKGKHFSTRSKSAVFVPVLFLLFFLEFYPLPLAVTSRNWISLSYLYLQSACKETPGAILEYPFEYRDRAKDIGKYLSLKTNSLLSSTLHSCPMLSGFSSFEPALFKKWQKDFDENGITDENLKILTSNKFRFIKINIEGLNKEEKANPSLVIHTKQLYELYRDSNSIIYKIIY